MGIYINIVACVDVGVSSMARAVVFAVCWMATTDRQPFGGIHRIAGNSSDVITVHREGFGQTAARFRKGWTLRIP